MAAREAFGCPERHPQQRSWNIYLILGNGTFDTSLDASGFPLQGDCGNCYAKISSTSPLLLLDYFTPLNTAAAPAADVDFGSGGPLLLPDLAGATGATRHLAVGSGKDANIYVLDRDNMGKFNPNQDNVYELISGQLAGGVRLRTLIIQSITAPSEMRSRPFRSQTPNLQSHPHRKAQTCSRIQERSQAFLPTALPTALCGRLKTGAQLCCTLTMPRCHESCDRTLYNSNQAANSRDQFAGNKFITPYYREWNSLYWHA